MEKLSVFIENIDSNIWMMKGKNIQVYKRRSFLSKIYIVFLWKTLKVYLKTIFES